MDKRRVLIVDDEIDVCEFLVYFFESKGYDTKYTTEGTKVAEIVEEYKPQIVLLDIRMPDMDGLRVLKTIEKHTKNIGVIVITGWLDEEMGRKALALGAIDFITKPIDLDYLEKSVLVKVISMLELG